MKLFKISIRHTKRGVQVKVSSKYRHYYRYLQTMEGAMCFAQRIAKGLKEAHKRCENISLFVNGEYKENLLESV